MAASSRPFDPVGADPMVLLTMMEIARVYRPFPDSAKFEHVSTRLPRVAVMLFASTKATLLNRVRTALWYGYRDFVVMAANLSLSALIGDVFAGTPFVDRRELRVTLIVNNAGFQANAGGLQALVEAHLRALQLNSFAVVAARADPTGATAHTALLLATWASYESLVAARLTRGLGCVGFPVADLQTLVAHARIRPQLELLFDLLPPALARQAERIRFCQAAGIAIMEVQKSHAPFETALAGDPAHADCERLVMRIAAARRVHPEDVILRWLLQLGLHVCLHSQASAGAIAARRHASLFELSPIEMAALCALPQRRHEHAARPSGASSSDESRASPLSSASSSDD